MFIHEREKRLPLKALLVATAGLLLSLFVFQVVATILSSKLLLGVSVDTEPGHLRITAVLPGSPAERADFQPGTILSRVNDHPVRNSSDIAKALRSNPGSSATVILERDGREQAYAVTPGIDPGFNMLMLNFLVLAIYIGLGLMALRARQLDRRLGLFAAFCLVVALDVATEGNYQYFPRIMEDLLFLEQVLAALQFSLIIHLLSLIPSPAPWMSRHRMRSLALIYGANLVLFLFFALVRFGYLPVDEELAALTVSLGRNNVFYIAWGMTALLVLILQYRRSPEKRDRGQLNFIIVGVVPWVLFQIITPFLQGIPAYQGFWYPILDVLTHLAFPLAILFAIFRYNLLDLNDFVSHRAIRRFLPLLLLSFIAIITISGILWSWPPPRSTGLIWLIATLSLATGLLYQPLQQLVTGTLERSQTPEGRNLGKNLRLLSRKLDDMGSSAELEQFLNRELSRILNCRFVHLDIEDGNPSSTGHTRYPEMTGPTLLQPGLSSPGARSTLKEVELLLPLHHERRHLGALLLGRNRHGHLYTPREVELLGLFADNVATRLATFRLQRQLEHDDLTGLLRRENILDQVRKATRDYLAGNTPFSIAMLDLDNFKAINDGHGHLFGDQVL